ncbi:hypothetical protein V6N12_076223, partial [Hibiscus sabdariffa]
MKRICEGFAAWSSRLMKRIRSCHRCKRVRKSQESPKKKRKEKAQQGISRRLGVSASEESLWAQFCSQDLHLSSPQDHHGNPLPSFKVAYQLWREAFSMYPWPLVTRVKRCWDKLKKWLSNNFPEAEATLRRGASESDIEQLQTLLKVKLPLPTRLLYRFHDGQEVVDDKENSRRAVGSSLGIIGGYSFYNHLVNVYLLPISQVIVETRGVIRHLGFSSRSKYVMLAASSAYSEKLFFLNCTNGQLYVGTRNLPTDGEMIPCVPSALIRSVHSLHGDQQQDAMLLWLEEHGRRLENGIIKVRKEQGVRSINLFPEVPLLCSTAVTNGVQVRASAVFVPEFADLQNEVEKYRFAYSIRMSLLPEGCVINGMTFGSCQLSRRHWIIRANEDIISDFSGEAVIGKFPLLHPGEDEFVYESGTPLPSSSGSIEGSFTFVPGRLADPKGSPFEAQVARRLGVSASEESLWAQFCSQDLHLSSPQDHHGNPLPSFKVAYQLWREAFSMYPWPLVTRVKRCWDKLKKWLSNNFPEAEATLRRGASESDIERLQTLLRVKLPLPTRLLYRFHDGQEVVDDKENSRRAVGSSLGIIGGYSFYNHLVNVCLLPISQVIVGTREVIRDLGFSSSSKYVILAASSAYGQKVFFLNCTNGQLYVGTRNLPTDEEMIPCVPSALIRSVHNLHGDQQQDAMLLWLEEHGHRLENGIIKIRKEQGVRSINLFPEAPPLCSTAVTNGVQ